MGQIYLNGITVYVGSKLRPEVYLASGKEAMLTPGVWILFFVYFRDIQKHVKRSMRFLI
jgi:hypothetical protein